MVSLWVEKGRVSSLCSTKTRAFGGKLSKSQYYLGMIAENFFFSVFFVLDVVNGKGH